jgi:hypothetical protein
MSFTVLNVEVLRKNVSLVIGNTTEATGISGVSFYV